MPEKFKIDPSCFGILDTETASDKKLVEDVFNTYDYFVKQYIEDENFIPKNLAGKIRITMGWHALVAAVGHARVDMIRWGAFHLSKEPNPKLDRHKYAGFLSKWIAKVRPVNLEAEPSIELPLA